jgi:branched-chain amino acid transport system permease protein
MSVRTLILLVIGLGILIFAPLGQGGYIVYVLSLWLVFSIAAMGLNLTLGYAGQVSLAQAAFMGIGAYTTALLTMAGIHWLLAAPLAIVLNFVIGLLLGYPALRVQHHFLAFVTLAFNTLVFLVLRNEEWLTKGSFGIVGIPRPNFWIVNVGKPLYFYYFVLLMFVISALLLYGIIRSPWGRAFRALRENAVRANSLGVDIRRMTLLAFAIGSAFGGFAGALMAPLVQFIDPPSFAILFSIKILLMVVVGGSGYFFGPVLGAGIVILLPELLRFTEGYYLMLYALLVMILMIFCPSGLIGLGDKLTERLRPQSSVRRDMKQGAQL